MRILGLTIAVISGVIGIAVIIVSIAEMVSGTWNLGWTIGLMNILAAAALYGLARE